MKISLIWAVLWAALFVLVISACDDDDPAPVVAATVAPTYTIGGTVTGLTGTLVLQNSGADNLTLTADGAFTFAS